MNCFRDECNVMGEMWHALIVNNRMRVGAIKKVLEVLRDIYLAVPDWSVLAM